MIFHTKEEVIAMTPFWKGERSEDGRPHVADRYLDALYGMTLEELWKAIYTKGYINQFISMTPLHPEYKEDGSVNTKMVGRALTAVYGPSRPDYYEISNTYAIEHGHKGTANQWIIDSVQDRDIIVVDMYDKVYEGTFVGGNLSTAIKTHSHSGGAVIWGGIRDLEQIKGIDGINVYYRGVDPTPIRDFVMFNMNGPVRLGSGRDSAICLPGDIVFGAGGGVLFIPPHLVAEVVDTAAKTQVKDIFGFEVISANRYTTAEVDKEVWSVEMLDELVEFIKTDERCVDYRSVDWSPEYERAKNEISNIESSL